MNDIYTKDLNLAAMEERLRPSNAHRFMVCTASVAEESRFPDSTSTYAIEGSIAHKVAEICLRDGTDPGELIGTLMEIEDGSGFVNLEMVHAVEQYLEAVRAQPGELFVEETGDLHGLLPNNGRVDSVVIDWDARVTRINDFKHGHRRVYATGNKQLLCYAAGIWNKNRFLGEFDKFELNIIQPRINHTDTWTVDRQVVEEFATELKRIVEVIAEQDTEFVAGAHCKYCRFASRCVATSEEALRTASSQFVSLGEHTFSNPTELSAEDVDVLMSKVDTVRDWANAIETRGKELLMEGTQLSNWKLVLGRRGNRKFDAGDHDTIKAECRKMKIPIADVAPRKLLSPSQLEKVVNLAKGNGAFRDRLSSFITQTPAEPHVVPASAPGESYEVTADEFEDLSAVQSDPSSVI